MNGASPPPGPPSIRVLPAGAGVAWLAQSFALIRAQPARLLLLTLLLHAVFGLSQVPVLGILVILAVPALSAGLLQGLHQAAGGLRPGAAVLLGGLASSPRSGRLLALGALMFVAGMLTASLVLGLDPNSPDVELLARIERGDMDALAQLDPAFLLRMGLALAAAVAVTGTISFMTIPLIWFTNMKLGAAVVTGLKAMLVNWKPFLMLALGLAGLLIPAGVVLGILAQFAATAGAASIVALLLITLALLLFQLVLFGIQYCSYRTIFGTGEPPKETTGEEPDGDDDSQLVA